VAGTATLLSVTGIMLQYSLLILVYFFLFKVLKLAFTELSSTKSSNSMIVPSPVVARLVVISTGKAYNIDESVSIGRSDHNDIIVDDSFVSYEHACITAVKQNFILTDLNSTNGTYLNDNKIDSDVVLQPGDAIKIGPVTFKFER
jgi:pSer/pThr/pTyr-binding forkhead associated (FHA) protein